MTVLFHGDGDSTRGIGHLVRCLSLAMEMPQEFETFFATSNPTIAQTIQKQLHAYYPRNVEILPIPSGEPHWSKSAIGVTDSLVRVAKNIKADVIVSDGKYPWDETQVERLSKMSSVVLIDNLLADRSHAQLIILPTDHASDEIKASIPTERFRTGIEWTWIHPAAKTVVPEKKEFDISVSLGGADPKNLTAKAIERINESHQFSRKAVVIGASFAKAEQIRAMIKSDTSWTIIEGARGSHQAFANSKLVLCAFGITPYECYAMKIPTWITTHDAEGVADAKMFLKRHSDAGELVDLTDKLPTPKALTPKPLASIGHLSQNLANEILGL